MSRAVTFDKYFDSRGTSIYVPADILEEMGLPTESKVIEVAEPYVHVQLFKKNGNPLARNSVSGCCPGRVFIGQYKGSPFTRATCQFGCVSGGQHSLTRVRSSHMLRLFYHILYKHALV